MKLTSLRRLAAGASAAALVSASAFFGSSAAFAQPTPEENETAAVQSADAAKEADKAEKKADETKQPEKKAEPKKKPEAKKPAAKKSGDAPKKDAKKTAKSEATTTPSAEPTETTSAEPTTTPTATPSPDPTATPTEEPTQAPPEFSIDKSEITAEDLRNTGVTVTAENLLDGEALNVTIDGARVDAGSRQGGTETVMVKSDKSVEELEAAGKVAIKVWTAADAGVHRGEKTFEVTIKKQEKDFDPQVTAAPEKIAAEDLVNPEKGVTVTATNLKAGDKLTDSLSGESVVADGETLEMAVYSRGKASDFKPGQKVEFDVKVERGEELSVFYFTVTIAGEDDAPAFDPKVNSAPAEITADDLTNEDKGINIYASNLQPGDVVTNNLTNEPETADGDELWTRFYYDGDPSDFKVGDKIDFTVTVTRGEESKSFDFTVTIVGEEDDDDVSKPKLKVAPEKISVADFRNEKKGVKLTVTGCYPDAPAAFYIKHEKSDLSHTVEAEVSEDGTAVAEHIHGKGNAPDSAFLGKYTVTVVCGDGGEAHGAFTVHSGGGDSKGGGDSDRGGRHGNQLPRTGSDLTALYGAAGLLAVGGAAIAIGRRKTAKK